MIALPSTSVAESRSAEKRLELEKMLSEQSEENLMIKDNPFGPTVVLRLLLWMRNLVLLALIGVLLIVRRIRKLFNRSASTIEA